MVEEVKSTHDFLNLKEEWNNLAFEDPSSTVFQTWEWNFNIWKHAQSRSEALSIILIREKNGNLVGIAPFYSYKRSVFGFKIQIMEFLGKDLTDYRCIIARGPDNVQISTEILNWLNEKSKQWDIVDLHYISEESPIVKNYNALFQDFSFSTVLQQHNFCPYMTLYSHVDLYENLYNPGLVKYLKRKIRKFEKDLNYKFLEVSNLSELDRYLNNLFDLHKKRRNQKLQLGTFRSKDKEKFFTSLSYDLFKKGWLKLLFLLVDDEEVACLYNFKFKNKIYFYQSGLDPNPKYSRYSLGYIIHYLALKEAVDNQIEEYDFLSGNEDYKQEWTKSIRNLYRIRMVSQYSYKAVFFQINEKLLNFFYNSKFYKSKLTRKVYFLLRNLRQFRMRDRGEF
jgi:CelD/BcsL family acetyltransferase involved in cellulose biosynthesis